jgi:hypothetical protein
VSILATLHLIRPFYLLPLAAAGNDRVIPLFSPSLTRPHPLPKAIQFGAAAAGLTQTCLLLPILANEPKIRAGTTLFMYTCCRGLKNYPRYSSVGRLLYISMRSKVIARVPIFLIF